MIAKQSNNLDNDLVVKHKNLLGWISGLKNDNEYKIVGTLV